jgi:DNA invertase Pin-like site-specific DNA recombinase
LRERAQTLGWRENQVVVIDDDLGISGAHSENRPGYQRLVSMLALREVGIVLGIEVSRLARNCLDWYQLLEIASAFGALIGDEDTVSDPSDFNDRLLLGLKGTISEVELHQIRSRMMRGRMNKARRGDLEVTLPIGYERDAEGRTVKTADRAVRSSVERVFGLFHQLRSIRAVLRELRRRKAELPYWEKVHGLGPRLAWRAPTYDALYNMLRNPTFAGIYVYGRRKSHYDPVKKVRRVEAVPSSEWEVVLPAHHEGYVTRQEHDEILATLRNNGYTHAMRGAAREGAALLQGLMFCKRCGLKMRARYSQGRCYYYCDQEHRRRGEPICGRASITRVDGVFEEMFLDLLHDGTVDLTFQLARRHREESAAIGKQWEQKVSRLQYEANLAQRRYESVDPENRLVASTLESNWNKRLESLEQAKADYARACSSSSDGPGISVDEAKAALRGLPDRWRSGSLPIQDKKELIRSVVDKVFLNTEGTTIRVEVLWHGGSLTELDVPKYIFSSGRIYHRVLDLARENTDGEIAEVLNTEQTKTVKGRPWTARRVMDFRLSNGIASCFTNSPTARLPAGGYVTSAELADRLGVHIGTIQKWYRLGILEGRQTARQAQLWIRVDDDLLHRLGGAAAADKSIVSIRRLMRMSGQSERDIVASVKQRGDQILRLRRGNSLQFYVRPAADRRCAAG